MMGLLDDQATRDQVEGLIQIGEVAQHGPGRVRVKFLSRDGVSSGWLSVLHPQAGDHSLPALGTSALCLLLPPDLVDGWVLGIYYPDTAPPPTTDPAVRVLAGDDVRLGSVNAAHKAPLGDVLLKILTGLRELLASVQVATPAGPGQLTAVTTSYGSGPVAAIAGQMAADVADAALLSQRVRVLE